MEYKYFVEEDIASDSRYLYLHTDDQLCMGDHLIHASGEIIKILGFDDLTGVHIGRGAMGTESCSMRRGDSLLHLGDAE